MSIIQSLWVLSTLDSIAFCSSKHKGWKLGTECWLESSLHVRKVDTDKSVSLCNAFAVNQGIMPWGADGGYSLVASMNSSEK